MTSQTIGMVGLGLLGSALAERFRGAGFPVVGFDRDTRRCAALAALGGQPMANAREVARACRRLVLSLPDTPAATSALEEIAPELGHDSLIVDTTTGDPEQTAAIGAELSRRGVRYLDATIAGSSEQVRSADVIVMVGGAVADAEACADLFACFARAWYHIGPWGSGARMKLVVNLVLGLNRAVLAEGLAFAHRSGLDLAQTLRILQASAAYSRGMDTKGNKMIERDFQRQARLSQHLKDVRLILAAAERAGAPVPLSQVHCALLERVAAAGWGQEDNAAVIRAYD